MTTARATRFLAVGLTGAALLFAGCGGDDDNSATTAAAADTSADTTASTTASTTPADPAATPIRNPFREPTATAHPGARVDQLQIRDVTVGDGEEIHAGDTAIVDYYGTLYSNGRKFDASWDRREPLTIRIDNGGVIAGWWQGIPGMRIGGRRTLVIPPALGYGAQAQAAIPANSTLFFTVDLLGIQRATAPGAAPTDPNAAPPAG